MRNPERWLILDCNYLCWRAFYSTGALKFGKHQTGVVYGFLKEVRSLQDLFATQNIIFTFDVGKPLRSSVYHAYKANREHKKASQTKAEKAAYQAMQDQVDQLRLDYLPGLGYRNVFWSDGYEADDIIAKLILDAAGLDSCIIVTADADMYQLLGYEDVVLYNPQKKETTDEDAFQKMYGVPSSSWAQVKAIAGCVSDNIRGIQGVGEKTAIKFLQGTLVETTKTYKAIRDGTSLIKHNHKLVTLPFPKTPLHKIQVDDVTPKKWRVLADKLGMVTLRDF